MRVKVQEFASRLRCWPLPQLLRFSRKQMKLCS